MMTLQNTLPTRFTKIDELTLHQHYHLTEEDECYFLGLYTTAGGHSYSNTNQTIYNFKKTMDKRGKTEWKYKNIAIRACAKAFAEAIQNFDLDTMTFVPVPPSSMKSDPLYDDRLFQMLKLVDSSGKLNIRECVEQTREIRSSHGSTDRPTLSEIAEVYKFRQTQNQPHSKIIAIVDDVITTGAHFRVMRDILSDQFPNVNVIGLFLARRESPSNIFTNIFQNTETLD